MLERRISTIKQTPTPILLRIKKSIILNEPDADKKGGFGSFALDDLYDDIDYELTYRGFN